jgi:taurine---2-oxoglutarate transaminase
MDKAILPPKTGLSDAEIKEYDRDYVITPWRAQANKNPEIVTHSKGNYFWTTENKRYLDFTSQYVYMNIGHTDDTVVNAIVEQAQKLPVIASSFATEARSELAHLLAELSPGDLCKSAFSSTGSEANETAIKVARLFTGKQKIISRYNSYHGSTFGSVALTRDLRSYPFDPAMPGVIYAMPCNPYRCSICKGSQGCTGACVSHIEDVIRYNGGSKYVGAIIIEPVTGANGIIVPPDGYMEGLRQICDKYELLLIADEIMTGFGRTGKWFASEHWGITPDVMTLAKGLTSGYVPLSVTMVNKKVAGYFDENPFLAGSTYSGHVLGCAAAVANIKVYQQNNLIERSAEMGRYLKARATELMEKHPSVGDVRGLGLMVGMELVKDRATREPLIDSQDEKGAALKQRLISKMLERGIFMYGAVASVLLLTPPLTITGDEIDWAITALDEVLEEADQAVA